MAFSLSLTNAFFLVTLLAVLLPARTYAFGAGDIPDFAYLNDKAFRHGDIENILETIVKSSGAAIGGSSLLGFASSVIKHASGGSKKFTKSDIKKVYFGNWLRDYSQAMDIAGLSKLSADTLVLIVAVLGFMTFGFASDEFQVTADRLGVYLPVEHIDNPKGYAEKEGDARKFHPKLRPPVSPRELEIDPKTGMKKYIATENQGWDTSTAFIRRAFKSCIEHGRRAQGNEGAELWEAYRLLGTGLHTMEDLLAHSNWCELALRRLGHRDVFCHVGDNVTVNTPNGKAPPLVTGTFGSADFMHSLLGEAGDKLSQASVTDLSAKMDNSSQGQVPDLSILKGILGKLGGGEDKLNQGEEIKKQSQAYNFDPDNIAPPEVQRQLLELLKWHDDIFRNVNEKIEMVPGLTNLMDEFSNALNEYIYTILAPYLGPILTQATGILNEGSKAVIESDDQYEVFNNPNASDPSHSLLSKDHFGLILNEPAGKIAQVVVENSVNLIVKAWNDDDDADQVITQILEAFHHPYYESGRSAIQNKMMERMQIWVADLGSQSSEILQSLTKESVRNHKNKRPGLDDSAEEAGYGGCGHGYKPSKNTGSSINTGGIQTYNSSGNNKTSTYKTPSNQHTATPAYIGSQSQYTPGSHEKNYTNAFEGHVAQRQNDDNSYGRHHSRQEAPGFGEQERQDIPAFGGHGRPETSAYGGNGREETSEYDGQGPMGQGRQETISYGSGRRDGAAYGQHGSQEIPSYGGHMHEDARLQAPYGQQETPKHGRQSGGRSDGYSRQQPQLGYNGSSGDHEPSYSQPEEDSYGRNNDNKLYPNQLSYGGGRGSYGTGDQSSQADFNDERAHKTTHGQGGGNEYTRSSHKDDHSDSDDNKTRHKHGSSRDDFDDDNRPYPQQGGRRYGAYDGQAEAPSFEQPQYQQQEYYGRPPASGYGPSHGGRDNTFGVERLDIGRTGGRNRDGSDSEDDKRHSRRHGHGGY